MATSTGGSGGGASAQAAAASQPAAPAREVVAVPSPQAILKVPVVYSPRKRGGKRRRSGKPRYSRRTGPMQRFLFGVSRACFRSANAVSSGLRTYTKRSDRSRRRKRDGMITDVFRNMSRGFADAAAEFGRAPGEVANRVSAKTVRRTFRYLTPIRI